MKAVYRYDLDEVIEQEIEIPRNAQLLKVERQTRLPLGLSLWALIDPDEPMARRKIFLVGTGHLEVPDSAIFISTYQEPMGFVWHFFDGGES